MAKRSNWKKNLEAYGYLLPSFSVIAVFGVYPLFYTVYVSLFRWRIRQGDFLGLENYATIFGDFRWLGALLVALVLFGLALKLREQSLVDLRQHSHFRGQNRISLMSPQQKILYGASWLVILVAGGLMFFSLPYLHSLGDDRMFDSLRVTIWYSLGAVPLQLGGGLFLAWMLNRKFKGRQFFRVIYLLPYIVPVVAGAAIFERLFSLRPESFANQVLLGLGMPPQEWLLERRGLVTMLTGWAAGESGGLVSQYWQTWLEGPSLALVSILAFNWWVFTGYYALIFANGLSQIPKELYEAAEVDGAPRRSVFFRIVLPLLSPTTYFLTLLGVIGTFKSFSHIWVLRNDLAGRAADPLSIYIFTIFYGRSRFGYASALSIVLTIIVLLLTAIQQRAAKDRVHYGE